MKAKTLWAWTIGLILATFALGYVAVFHQPTKSPTDLVDAPPPASVELSVTGLDVGNLDFFSRVVDEEAGVACWVVGGVYGRGVSCLPIYQTRLGGSPVSSPLWDMDEQGWLGLGLDMGLDTEIPWARDE